MGRKHVAPAKQLESAKTLASDFQTSVYEVNQGDVVAFVIDCNSVTDNTGTFTVQVRFRKDKNTVTSWVDLTLDSTPTLANAAEEFYIQLSNLVADEVRISFVAAGGTPDGTCDIWAKHMSIGA